METRKDYLREIAAAAGMRRYRGHRLLMMQHLHEETLRGLFVLKDLFDIDAVLGLPGAHSPHVVQALRQVGVRVLTPDAAGFDALLRAELAESLHHCGIDGRRLILHEAGGHAVELAHQAFGDRLGAIAGAVLTTPRSVPRLRELEPLAFPVVHAAELPVDDELALRTGEAVVATLEQLTRKAGLSLAGRRALVTGYGPHGRGICYALARRGIPTGVVDTDPVALARARAEGVPMPALPVWLPEASLVIGAAGMLSVTDAMLARLPDGALVASGSSRDLEIDVAALQKRAAVGRDLAWGVRSYGLRDGRTLYLFNDGFPVSFAGEATSDEVVESAFAEVRACAEGLVLTHRLATRRYTAGLHSIARAAELLPEGPRSRRPDAHLAATR